MAPAQTHPIHHSARALHAALLAAATLALTASGPCDSGHVTGPGDGSGGSTRPTAMSRLWPNEDGRAFDYAVIDRALAAAPVHYYPTTLQVPQVSINDVAALLAVPPAIIPGSGSDYAFRMQFSGDMTTQSGVRTQNLAESFPPIVTPLRGSEADFLARLAAARPDLRARIARYLPRTATLDVHPYPNFIHGYGFIKGPLWIGSYGDADTLLAWKFLDSNLTVGHIFQHQLVPSLADSIYLTAKVAQILPYPVPGHGTVKNCVELLYLIDYGITSGTDESGALLGFSRWFDYGRVIYAPDIGPVLDEERRLAYAGQADAAGAYYLLLNATAVTPGSAALATAW